MTSRQTNCPQCRELTVATNRNATLWICPNGHQFPVEGAMTELHPEDSPVDKVTDTKFNPTGNTSVHLMKSAALEYQRIIMLNAPAGRERAVALTHLKTCSMWAVSSLFPTGEVEMADPSSE